MIRFGGWLAVALWVCACAAWAGDGAGGGDYQSCARLTRVVVAWVGLEYRPNLYHDCRRWPPDEARSLVAVGGPCHEPSDRETDANSYCDLNVVLVDSRSGRTLKSLFEPNEITSDAMRFSGVRLDVAPYVLAPGARAFGVRMQGEGVTSSSDETLNLYVDQGGGLRKVLESLVVRRSAWGDDDITTIAIGGAAHHGLADLRVTSIEHDPEIAGKKRRYVMRYVYDGRLYREEQAPPSAAAGSPGESR